MARLLLITPEGQQTVELRAHNSLGRHPSNSVQVLDKIVSKEHCIIERRGPVFVLRDLGSLNGTYVNGERVQGERALASGDELALGMTRARFEGDPASSVLPTPGLRPSPGAPPGPQTPERQPPATAGFAVVPAGPVAPGTSPSGPPMTATRVDVTDKARAIGTQIAATQKGFLPFDQVVGNPAQLSADYERLRLSHELSREIALERDLPTLLHKILQTIFRFVRADRGVIFLMDDGELIPGTSQRRDGTEQPIEVSSTIMNHVIKERATVLTHDAAMDFAASKGKSMILNRISSAIVAPLLHDNEILGVLWLDSETLAQFQPKDMEIVTAIAAQAAMFIEINILAKKIEREVVNRERFSRLLSPNVAERVLSGELEVKKGGQLVSECTIFNSDIRGFTSMSERSDPETIVEMLNDYFEHMVETLFKYEGTLDKFMGDGIMALWGAPVAHPDDALRAVSCAIEQMEILGRFNRRRMEANQPPLAVGMGIHTGPVVAGYIGSSRALSYTVIGDVANTSARLCGVAAGGQILIGEATLAKLGGKFEVEELPPAHLKNKEKPFRVFNITRVAATVQVPAVVTA
jgi:adenylate cyclase